MESDLSNHFLKQFVVALAPVVRQSDQGRFELLIRQDGYGVYFDLQVGRTQGSHLNLRARGESAGKIPGTNLAGGGSLP